MRLLRLSGNSIYRGIRRAASVIASCCNSLWKDNEKWDEDCVWTEGCDDTWYNNEIWDSNEIWPICQSQSNQLPLNFPIELE